MATQQNPPNPTRNMQLVVGVIYVYMIVFNLVLPVVVFNLYPPADGEVRSYALRDLFPADMTAPVNLAVYAIGLMSLLAGFILPNLIGAKRTTMMVSAMAAGQVKSTSPIARAFTPYIVRLMFFEMTTLCGFICAVLASTPQYIIPLGTLGIMAVIMSPPRNSLLESLANQGSDLQPGSAP